MTWLPASPRGQLLAAALGGLLGGVVLTVVVGALLPESDDESAGPASETIVTVPSVPDQPEVSSIVPSTSTGGSDEASDEPTSGEGEASGDSDDSDEGSSNEPDDAPLLPNAAPAGRGSLPDAAEVTCPPATETVDSADGLTDALGRARPGDSIRLAEEAFAGNFVTSASGSADEPIYLCGSAGSVIDGGDVEGDYALHLDGATHWRLVGFTVHGGQKGIVADGTVGSVFQGLTVSGTGDEAIHLRANSTDNVVLGNTVSDTGHRRDEYGEGIYVGSAVSNWCTYTECHVDRSDRNVIKDNTITGTTSEAIDIKEGTTGGVLIGNTFDGSAMTGADSWVDMKGNNYLIQGNTGVDAPEDGFQTHEILDGWGDYNVFTGNHADVGGPGLGIAARPEEHNVVHCDNTAVNAGDGLSNVPCTP